MQLEWPATLDGAHYASVADILEATDLAEMDVRILRWKKNGAPLFLRVRALDLATQWAITQEARVKDKLTGRVVEDEVRFAVATLREGIVVPKLNSDQAGRLRQKNPRVIEALVNLIWSEMSKLDQDAIEAAVYAQIDAEPEAESEADPVGDPSGEADGGLAADSEPEI